MTSTEAIINLLLKVDTACRTTFEDIVSADMAAKGEFREKILQRMLLRFPIHPCPENEFITLLQHSPKQDEFSSHSQRKSSETFHAPLAWWLLDTHRVGPVTTNVVTVLSDLTALDSLIEYGGSHTITAGTLDAIGAAVGGPITHKDASKRSSRKTSL